MARSGARRAIVAASVGTMIEGYDVLLYGYLAGVLADRFFPAGDPTAALLDTFAIFALGFAVRPLGGLVFGHVGDRAGRRAALAASMLLMAVATLAIGLLPTYDRIGVWASVLLLLCRLAQGFSIGGEYVGANILILERATAGRAGRWVSANQVAAYLGITGAAATSLLLAYALTDEQLAAWGWRLPFLAAVPLALIGLYLRLADLAPVMPKRPEWHLTSAGSAGVGVPLVAALRTGKRAMLVFAGWVVMVTVGGFLLFGYLPTYLARVVGLDPAAAFGANLAAMLTLSAGAVAGGFLVDRYPVRVVGAACAVGIALTVVPGFLVVQRGTVGAAIAGQVVWAAFVGVSATVTAVLSLSLFPAHMRFTATAMAYNGAVTLFGGTAPYVATWLIARTGSPIAPAWYLTAGALLALLVMSLPMVKASPK